MLSLKEKEKMMEERIIILADFLKHGAMCKFNKKEHMYISLTEQQLMDIKDNYEIDYKFKTYIKDFEDLIKSLISNPAENRKDIRKNIWPDTFITITGKQQYAGEKREADYIVWEFGEDEATKYCKKEFRLQFYDIICKADKHDIMLNYGNGNSTDVKKYFRKLTEKH